MTSSRVTRMGAAVLVSLIVATVITPAALAAYPTVPTPVPGALPAVAGTRITATGGAKSKSAHAAAVPQAVPATSGYSIEGTVTAVGGGSLSSIGVEADSTTSSNYYTTATAADGTYSVDGLPADTYDVWFQDPTGTHFNGYYSGGGVPVDYTSATSVPVTTATVTGINAQLALIAPWTISIQASATSLATGTQVTITATTNQNILLTNYDVYILRDDGTGWYCYSGTTCYVTDSLSSPGSATYHAIVALPPNATSIQATSSTVTVTWTGSFTGTPGTYHAIIPTRVLDTRFANGLSGKLLANTPATFQVAGRDQIPAGATAVTGNVTVVNSTSSWAIYLGPTPIAHPSTSTINFTAGQITGNGLTVALSGTGTLSATYVSNPGNTTDLVFDVTGYFTPDASGATYHPLTPARLLDTRIGNGLSGHISANTPATFFVTAANRPGSPVPAGATAVTGNVTVVNETFAWAIYVGPDPTPAPGTSTINFVKGDIKGNNLTVALGAGGSLSATYVSNSGNTTDLVFDVTGYYTPDATGSRYVPLTPARLLDTRAANGLSGHISANTPATFWVSAENRPGSPVPAGATAVTGNVTVVNETFPWAVFLGPVPNSAPGTSTINFVKGDIKGNGLAVALGSGGSLSATYVSVAGNTTDLVFDVTGYFAP